MLFALLLAAYFRSSTQAVTPGDPTELEPSLASVACLQFRPFRSIVWTCLLTVFACTWTAIHPNLPGPGEGKLRVLWTRIKLVLLAFVAPEYILFWAIEQRRVANEITAQARKKGFPDWTICHGFFVVMGGFVLENDGAPIHAVVPGQNNMEFGDFVFPPITEEQLQDRSKGDAFSKLIVVGQLAWFLVQCITRGAERLGVTELELVTAAYAALTTFIYIVWWNKPKDVKCYIPVTFTETGMCKAFSGWAEKFKSGGPGRLIVDFLTSDTSLAKSPKVPTLFTGNIDSEGDVDKSMLREYAAGMVFGAIHCIGWNFHFLSRMEQLLWRVASIVITSYPAFGFAFLVYLEYFYRPKPPDLDEDPHTADIPYIGFPVVLVGTAIYVVARLILLALPLAALRHLPEDAYRSIEWASIIPHLG